jgi:cytoskeletal protein RodZ
MSTLQDDGGNGRRIGELLERRRLERGLTLKEVEEATKIRTRYLEGLERDDYTVLPDAVYVRGFLKTYADYLGLDGEALAREMKERRAPRRERQMEGYGAPMGGRAPDRGSDSERPLLQPEGVAGTRRRRVSPATIITVLVVLVLLAVVIGALYRVGLGALSGPEGAPQDQEVAASREPVGGEDDPPDAEPATVSEATAPEEETAGPAPEGGRTEAAGGATDVDPGEIRAVVRVTEDGPSWISVAADGEIAYEQIAPVGFERTFAAREVFGITTYNAAGVEVEINGQSVGSLGEYGEFVEREFPLMPPSG